MPNGEFSVTSRVGIIAGVASWAFSWFALLWRILAPEPFVPGFGIPVLDSVIRFAAVLILLLIGPLTVLFHSYRVSVSSNGFTVRSWLLGKTIEYRLVHLVEVEFFARSIEGGKGIRLKFEDGRSQRCGAYDHNFNCLLQFLHDLGYHATF